MTSKAVFGDGLAKDGAELDCVPSLLFQIGLQRYKERPESRITNRECGSRMLCCGCSILSVPPHISNFIYLFIYLFVYLFIYLLYITIYFNFDLFFPF